MSSDYADSFHQYSKDVQCVINFVWVLILFKSLTIYAV